MLRLRKSVCRFFANSLGGTTAFKWLAIRAFLCSAALGPTRFDTPFARPLTPPRHGRVIWRLPSKRRWLLLKVGARKMVGVLLFPSKAQMGRFTILRNNSQGTGFRVLPQVEDRKVVSFSGSGQGVARSLLG